jgi:hypothetical protein
MNSTNYFKTKPLTFDDSPQKLRGGYQQEKRKEFINNYTINSEYGLMPQIKRKVLLG